MLRYASFFYLDLANLNAKSICSIYLHSLIAVSISNKSESKLDSFKNSSSFAIYFYFT